MEKKKVKAVMLNYTNLRTFLSEETIKNVIGEPAKVIPIKDKELWLYYAHKVKKTIRVRRLKVEITDEFYQLPEKILESLKETVEDANRGFYKKVEFKKFNKTTNQPERKTTITIPSIVVKKKKPLGDTK